MKEYSINIGYDWSDDECTLKSKYWLLRQVGEETMLNTIFDRRKVISFFNQNMEEGDVCYIHEQSGRVQKKITIIKKDTKMEYNPEQLNTIVKMIKSIIRQSKINEQINIDDNKEKIHEPNQKLGDIIDTCRIINDTQNLKLFDDFVKQCVEDFDKQQKQNIISKMKEDYKKEFEPYFNGTFKQFIGLINVFHPAYGNIPFQFTEQNLKIIKALESNQNLFIGKYRQVGATTLLALHIIYKALTIENYRIYVPMKRSNVGFYKKLENLIKINPELNSYKDRIMSCIEGNVQTYRNTIFTERIIDELDIQTYKCLYENEIPKVDFDRNIFTTSQLRLEDYFTSLGWNFKRLIMCG